MLTAWLSPLEPGSSLSPQRELCGFRQPHRPGLPAADGAFQEPVVPGREGDENENGRCLRENKLRRVPAGSSEVFSPHAKR